MEYKPKSIRPFIGSKDYHESRQFYKLLGFEEIEIGKDMCFFKANELLGFYLQDYYVKDWVDNTMLFLEIEELNAFETHLHGLRLIEKFKTVRISEIKVESWGRELFMHDPSGILWHFGHFNN